MRKGSELVDVELTLMHETTLAILVSDGDVEAWLPKSQVEYEKIDMSRITVTMPTWLAEKYDLIP